METFFPSGACTVKVDAWQSLIPLLTTERLSHFDVWVWENENGMLEVLPC